MSSDFAKAILKHYQRDIIARKTRQLVEQEWEKGCGSWIAPVAVELEPPHDDLSSGPRRPEHPSTIPWIQATQDNPRLWHRVQIWMSPEQKGDWKNKSERFLKQLAPSTHRIAMELLGNKDRIDQLLLFHQDDDPVVHAAFAGEFERCLLTPATWIPHGIHAGGASTILCFRDFFPAPPYPRLFTRPEELFDSVYGTIVSALAGLPREAFGILQVVFQSAHPQHDWHGNVRRLVDVEHEFRRVIPWENPHHNAHSPPTGDINTMAADMNDKAHNDKPFFFGALRLAVGGITEDFHAHMKALSAFTGMIQHGGRPLAFLDDTAYLQVLSASQISNLLAMGHTYRPGFLINSEELTTLANCCPVVATEHRPRPIKALEVLIPSLDSDLTTGVHIGICEHAGRCMPVCIPMTSRSKHTHIIGRPGTGKSSLLEYMILQEIALQHGVALIDPHGLLVDRLLDLIPADHVDRVVYINPSDSSYVPIWNPLYNGAAQDPGRIAADLVSAIHSIVSGWGDRLAHLLRHAFFALLHIPGASLRDAADLLRKGTPASDELIKLITGGAVTNDLSRRFWIEDFRTYRGDDIRPPQHKLSTMLLGGKTVSLMLSQPDSKLNLRQIMDDGKILLVDLSGLGSDVCDTLGCFLLALLHLTALGRLDTPGMSPKPFHIYCDEAHHFMTETMDDLIAEARKFGVSLTLAHQFMSQFTSRKAGALSSVASTIMFSVDEDDAQHLKKDLAGRVDVKDLIDQGVGEAIARIGTNKRMEIVRVKTPKPIEGLTLTHRDAIIARSRQLYYETTEEVQRRISERNLCLSGTGQRSMEPPQAVKEFDYDEL